MYNLADDVMQLYKDETMRNIRRDSFVLQFTMFANDEKAAEKLGRETWLNCYTHGVMADQFDIIKILKKHNLLSMKCNYCKGTQVYVVQEEGREMVRCPQCQAHYYLTEQHAKEDESV